MIMPRLYRKRDNSQIEALYNSGSPGAWEEAGLELNCFEFVQFLNTAILVNTFKNNFMVSTAGSDPVESK